MNVNKTNKEIVEKVIKREKIGVLIYPIIFSSLLYGIWISIFPSILENYKVYKLVSAFVSHWQVGGVFIILPILMLLSFKFNRRRPLLITSNLLLMIWSMFAVAFILSPPPNTVWIFAATMTYLTFSLVRRV